MEYFGMFASYLATSVVTTRLLLKQTDVINTGITFAQSGIIAVGIIIFTILFNMLRAYRVCVAKPNEKKSLGMTSGLTLSIWSAIFGLVMFVLVTFFTTPVTIIAEILPFLKDYLGVIIGFYVACAGITGYWSGRIFTSLC